MNIKNRSQLKTLIISLFCFCFFSLSIAQDEAPKNTFWEKVRFGGGIGLSAGNGLFSATLAPSAIYPLSETVALGVGLTGTYFSRKNSFNSTVLGGSIIGLVNPIQEIQLSAEFEQLHVSRNFSNPTFLDDNYWYPALFVGAGYRTRNVTIGLRYDVLYNDNTSVYANAWAPFIRVYF